MNSAWLITINLKIITMIFILMNYNSTKKMKILLNLILDLSMEWHVMENLLPTCLVKKIN